MYKKRGKWYDWGRRKQSKMMDRLLDWCAYCNIVLRWEAAAAAAARGVVGLCGQLWHNASPLSGEAQHGHDRDGGRAAHAAFCPGGARADKHPSPITITIAIAISRQQAPKRQTHTMLMHPSLCITNLRLGNTQCRI